MTRLMTRWTFTALMLFGLGLQGRALAGEACTGASVSGFNPGALYGPKVVFDIYRNGHKVGEQVTSFADQGNRLEVTSDMKLKVKFLFITAYRYHYKSQEIWCGDKLTALTSHIDDNGDRHSVVASSAPGGLEVTGLGQRPELIPEMMPTTHWNVDILTQHRLLNSITGRVNRVLIKDLVQAEVETGTGLRLATRYEYTGDVKDTDVWYDTRGRWVRLQFKAKDGSEITYVCRDCGGVKISSN